jgi:precorrin-6A synthase
LNGIGESILITTGRRLTSQETALTENIAVMLDGQCSFKDTVMENWDIFWGAYLGMDEEMLLSGKLAEVAAEIERLRSEARERNGWIMDTYLLRRSVSS